MMQAVTGGDEVLTITISEATSTISASYDAIQTAIGSEHGKWFAWVDDYSYVTGGGDKIVACFGNAASSNDRAIYRNDNSYGNYRRYNYGSSVGKIPANTQFKVIIMPES